MSNDVKETEVTGSFFDKIYNAGSEVLNALQKQVAKQKLKSKFQNAFAGAYQTKMEAENNLFDLYTKSSDVNMDKVIENIQIMEEADKVQEIIKKEYLRVFGKAMKNVLEDED